MALTAEPIEYGTIALTWDVPSGVWDRVRLVRSAYGIPFNKDDGLVLLDVNCGPGAASGYSYPLTPALDQVAVIQPLVTSYVDNTLTTSSIYYYALFVQMVGDNGYPWVQVGSDEAQSVGDNQNTTTMLHRLPGIFTSGGELGGQPDPTSALGQFLSLFGFDQDRTQDFLNGLLLNRSPSEMDGNLLPAMAPMLNYHYEPGIGMRQNKEVLANAAFLNQVKGTEIGIAGLASAATTWGAAIEPLTNLFHDDNDTLAQGTTDRWVTQSATLSHVVAPDSTCPSDPNISLGNFAQAFGALETSGNVATFTTFGGHIPTTAVDATHFFQGAHSMKLTWATGTPGGFGIGSGVTTTINGLVVGQTYTFSAEVFNSIGNNPVLLFVAGMPFDATAFTTVTGSFQQVYTTFVATAASHQISICMPTSTAGWVSWVDAVGFNVGLVPLPFSTTPTGHCFAVQATVANNAAINYVNGLDPTTYGIPITGGLVYTFSGFMSAQGSTPTITGVPSISWFDRNGNLISVTTGTAFTTPGTASSWGQFSVTGVAPGSAVYAEVGIAFTTIANGEIVYLDCFQFEQAAIPSTFQRARQIDIIMIANRINEVLNPGFDVDITQWGSNDATTSRSTTTTFDRGIASMEVTPSTGSEPPIYPAATLFPGSTTYPGGGLPAVYTEVSCDAEAPFTFACQIFPLTTGATIQLSLKWINNQGTSISTDTGAAFVCAHDTWTRVYMQSVVPSEAVAAVLTITEVAGTGSFFVDDVMGEETSILQDYFGPQNSQTDVLWEGTTAESRSHLYYNFSQRSARLLGLLPTQVPVAASFQVLYAQARIPTGAYGVGIYGDGIYGR